MTIARFLLDAGFQARLRRLRRNIDREEKQSVETYRTVAGPAQVRGLVGVTQVLPPGHQELTRRAAPTVIMPVEVPMPPIEAMAAPFDIGAGATLAISEPPPPPPSTTSASRRAVAARARVWSASWPPTAPGRGSTSTWGSWPDAPTSTSG